LLGYASCRACITNTLIKTTVRNKYLFVLDFIVHYYNMFQLHDHELVNNISVFSLCSYLKRKLPRKPQMSNDIYACVV
jgi:hypothetical protein